MGTVQAKNWLKGIASGAAFAALVALPMFNMSAGKVSYSDLSFGSGAGKVMFQDFHFARVSTGKAIPKATLY